MLVYRIAKQEFIKDLSGIGAKTVGGRWNRKGVAILYTSSSISLSVLEILAHVPTAYFPEKMALATIELPDNLISSIPLSHLQEDWNKIPAPSSLQNITSQWIEEGKYLGHKVPSTIVPQEQNVLINPIHTDFNSVKLVDVKSFSFDTRLVK